MQKLKELVLTWKNDHPDLWEFILFNVLSNCATVTNFVAMWICTGIVFTSLATTPFKFFIFDYSNVSQDLGLCGFLSFLVATGLAQTVNFFVQKLLVFKSKAATGAAGVKFALLAVLLVVVSSALPAYSQVALSQFGLPAQFVPTAANVINVAVQVVVSYPLMKFWIMPKVS